MSWARVSLSLQQTWVHFPRTPYHGLSQTTSGQCYPHQLFHVSSHTAVQENCSNAILRSMVLFSKYCFFTNYPPTPLLHVVGFAPSLVLPDPNGSFTEWMLHVWMVHYLTSGGDWTEIEQLKSEYPVPLVFVLSIVFRVFYFFLFYLTLGVSIEAAFPSLDFLLYFQMMFYFLWYPIQNGIWIPGLGHKSVMHILAVRL